MNGLGRNKAVQDASEVSNTSLTTLPAAQRFQLSESNNSYLREYLCWKKTNNIHLIKNYIVPLLFNKEGVCEE